MEKWRAVPSMSVERKLGANWRGVFLLAGAFLAGREGDRPTVEKGRWGGVEGELSGKQIKKIERHQRVEG